MRNGRPLRFLALALGGWAAARVVTLWQEPLAPEPAETPRATAPIVIAGEPTAAPGPVPGGPSALASRDPRPPDRIGRSTTRSRAGAAARGTTLIADVGSMPMVPNPRAEAATLPDRGPVLVHAELGSPSMLTNAATGTSGRSRLRGDAWLIARPNGGENLAFGQLGASQAGARVTYVLGRARTVALSGRVSAPLEGRGREVAVGLDWQPTALPVHLLVEQRIPLDGGAARPAVQLIGGVARRLPFDLRLEAYGQAGAVHRRGGFADGAARLARLLFSSRAATVDLGGGAWGAAQRGAARVDVGPTLGVSLPAGTATVRLSADYRLRVAGRARPGSGPALSIGTSF